MPRCFCCAARTRAARGVVSVASVILAVALVGGLDDWREQPPGDSTGASPGRWASPHLPLPPLTPDVTEPVSTGDPALDAALRAMASANPRQMSPTQYSYLGRMLIQKGARLRGCKLLVWGVGRDSHAWATLNSGPDARTVFLEDNEAWATWIKNKHPELDVRHVSFPTRMLQAGSLLKAVVEYEAASGDGAGWKGRPLVPPGAALMARTLPRGGLPLDIESELWDVVVVDAPGGTTDGWPKRVLAGAGRWLPLSLGYWLGLEALVSPGRMGSIWSSTELARKAAATKTGHATEVLVHDCERWVERAYSTIALGDEHTTVAGARVASTQALMLHYTV